LGNQQLGRVGRQDAQAVLGSDAGLEVFRACLSDATPHRVFTFPARFSTACCQPGAAALRLRWGKRQHPVCLGTLAHATRRNVPVREVAPQAGF